MNKNERFWIRFFAVVSIVFLCIGVTVKSFQNDTFYIIKLGDYILHNGIDLKDHWCWITQLSYTYPHWLYDVFMYLIYSNFNFVGIYISTIILFIFLILTIYIIHLKMHKNEFLALFVSLLSIVCLYIFATARAQLVTIILFLLEVYFIEKLIDSGKNRYIIFLTFISLLVANLHATIWLFYFILYFPFLGEFFGYKIIHSKLFRKYFKVQDDFKIMVEKIPHIKKLVFSFGLSLLMGIFTPSRICYTYVFRVMLGSSQSFIQEHAPLILIQHPCFLILVLVLLLVLIFSYTKIYLRELFMICGLILMSLVSMRHIIFFYTIGVLYISILCSRYLLNKKDKTLDILGSLFVQKKIIYVMVFILVIFCSYYQFQTEYKEDYVPKSDYPVEAVSYIKENLDVNNIKLYNDYNYGSYLMFYDIPVFIDSRCDLYLSEFNGLDYSIFDDVMEMEYKYEEKFLFYGVTHALVSNDRIIYRLLKKDGDYQILYEDEYFTLFESVVK